MGLVYSLYNESFPPRPQFSPDDVPDLSGKVIVVTGGNSGKETVKVLLAHNAKVYIAARSPERVNAAIEDLKQETGKEAIFLQLDLADLRSVKAVAEEFNSKEKELHVLFNNAGVMIPPIDALTAQGYDLQFSTNVLGHFYFTKLLLLLDALMAGAKSSPDGVARVVNTSSSASLFVSTIDSNTLTNTDARKMKGTALLYCQSKLGNVLFANELSRDYEDKGIVSTSLNPGNLRTDLQRYVSPFARTLLNLIPYRTPYGALTQLWAGASLEAAILHGSYLIPWARVSSGNPAGKEPVLARALWNWMEEKVEIYKR